MHDLKNKKALIFGVASQKSIAYGIAKQLHQHGVNLAFTYVSDRFEKRIQDIAASFDSELTHPCDVSDPKQITDTFKWIGSKWDHVDIIVHAIAFAPTELLHGDYLANLDQKGFSLAHEISSYSLSAICKEGRPLLSNASIITLSYIGAQQAIPNYNIMGVAKASLEANVRYIAACIGPEGHRVNAISAGPIRTLSASAIKNFKAKLDHDIQSNPMRRNVSIEDVGNTACFLASDYSKAITGEVIYVDNGTHILGVNAHA